MDFLETLFLQILNMGITAGYVILAVLIIRYCIRNMSKIFSYVLWIVVGFRLVCPISFPSLLSIFNFIRRNTAGDVNGTISYIPADAARIKTQAVNIAAAQKMVTNTQPAAAPVSVNPMQIVIYAATLVWMIGIAGLLLYCLISYLRLRKHVAKAVLMKENIYECDAIPSPFVMGLIKPRIYIPFRLGDQEQGYILLHEKYHIQRFDYLVKPLSFLLLIIYWFNPLVWVAYFCMSKDMEMSCDEKVIAEMGMSVKSDYSRSLLSFASNHRNTFAGPLAFGETDTKSRIKNILHFRKRGIRISFLIGMICVLTIAACAANPFIRNSNSQVKTDSKSYSTNLYQCRNPYIGDNSADSRLLMALNIPEEYGRHTMELETSEKPYILRINFEKEVTDRGTFDRKMCNYASLLLALIDNADEIQWSYPYVQQGETNRITVYWDAQNLKAMGIDDIKSYGKSAAKVQSLWNYLNHYDSTIDLSSAENVTDNTDGSPEDKKILTMSQYLTYKLPDNLVNGSYNAALGAGGGNLFLKDGKQPKGPEDAPVTWYAYGGVMRLTNKSAYSVTFHNGKLVSGSMNENHTSYLGKPILLKDTAEQAVIMKANHDLYTAAGIEKAKAAGKPIPKDEQTSTMYEIYFARNNKNTAYCIFLNKQYFTLNDAKVLAKSVEFKRNAFQ